MLKTTRKTYGNTWWGRCWIEALERIDTNRLARGKTYANTGKVLSCMVVDNEIIAKVKGSFAPYYNIKISLKQFSDTEINKIKEALLIQPSIAIAFSLGKLPEKFLAITKDLNINLLPQSWSQINAYCSCPDYANPCKHLASVYYMIANEIDKDPYLLLKLKGLNNPSTITNENNNLTADQNDLPDYNFHKTFLQKFIAADKLKLNHTNTDNGDALSFAYPKYDIESLLELLQENPPFFSQGNFKNLIVNIYKYIPEKITDLIQNIEETSPLKNFHFQLQTALHNSELKYNFNIYTDQELDDKDNLLLNNELSKNQLKFKPFDKLTTTSSISITIKKKIINKQQCLLIDNLNTVIDYFINQANQDLNPSPSFKFLHALCATAIGLIQNNLFLPEVEFISKENFKIKYIPLIEQKLLENHLAKLKTLMPADFFIYKNQFLPNEYLSSILSIIMTYLIKKILQDDKFKSSEAIIKVFCEDYIHKTKDFSQASIGLSIANWLTQIQQINQAIIPIIKIELDQAEMFKISIDVKNKNNITDPIIPLKELFKLNKTHELFAMPIAVISSNIAKQLTIASQYIKPLIDIVDSLGEIEPLINLNDLSDILFKGKRVLNILGIEIIVPKDLVKLIRPAIQIKAKAKDSNNISYLSLGSILNFTYEISLGDEIISAAQFRKLTKNASGLVKYKDQYVYVNPDEILNILNEFKNPLPETLSSAKGLKALITGEFNGKQLNLDDNLNKLIQGFTKLKPIQVPDNLMAQLRPYQEQGFKWLHANAINGFGSCLADDMGLGKTIQIITLLLHHKNEQKNKLPSLVICPLALIGNWKKECEKFAPTLNLNIYHGGGRKLNSKNIDLIITSYGTLRQDVNLFEKLDYNFLIIDEAQNIKNSDTNQTQAIKSLKANNYIAMTGTPVENRLSELWSLFDFINPGYLGNIKEFKKEFAIPIEINKDNEALEKFKKVTKPFILRRLKTDKSIITDLPDKISFDEFCYLTKEQASIYEAIVKETIAQIEQSKGITRKGLIFKLITSLKQLCNHPAQYTKSLNLASSLSGKTSKLMTILQNALNQNDKCLIFTQYTQMGELLKQMIETEMNEIPLYFHGQLNRNIRDNLVNEFQNNPKNKILILSLKAGGTGLNLTKASQVIHYDLWWNPAVENQATDRAYRIGQTQNVLVHRLITLGTFEEKINDMLLKKANLAELTVSQGESWITEMNNKELKELFTLYK